MRGWITEVNAEKNSYTIKLIGGPKLLGSYPRELASSVLDALSEFQRDKFQSCKVLVRGLADYDLNDQPVRVAETQHLELLDPNDVAARCEELAQLKDGWLDGEGEALNKEGLKWFAAWWGNHGTQNIPLPYIYPALEGGIRLEWTQQTWEIAAVISLESKQAELYAVDAKSHEFAENNADLNAPEGFAKLAGFITEHLAKAC